MTTDTKAYLDAVAGKLDQITDEDLDLALRVEDAIRSLDTSMRDDDRWLAAVDQWRRCVSDFGPGSHASNGALLGMVTISWDEMPCIDARLYDGEYGDQEPWMRYRAWVCGGVTGSGASLLEALTELVEECS